jgi:hypothetical protein
MNSLHFTVASAGILAIFSGCSPEAEHAQAPPSSVPIAPIEHDALFVVNGEDSTLSVINTEANELAGTIALKDAAYPLDGADGGATKRPTQFRSSTSRQSKS